MKTLLQVIAYMAGGTVFVCAMVWLLAWLFNLHVVLGIGGVVVVFVGAWVLDEKYEEEKKAQKIKDHGAP